MKNNISILDCTLRDGGYVNEWNFGRKNIKEIIAKLSIANIDIIECGFLSEKIIYNDDISKFDTISRAIELLKEFNHDFFPVFMINFGEYNINSLPDCDNNYKLGIRVAFHKKDYIKALDYCKQIKQKGYYVFVQPMVSVSYTDEELIHMVKLTNEIKPYAFYIVDSFGVMIKNDLMRLFYLVDHNLGKEVRLGYHSHNNMQMAFSNAQELVELNTDRDIIIDSCVMGMGRGAGNLNTELFIDYINERNGRRYKAIPLLQLIDQVIDNISLKFKWGYTLPYYLSASNNCHPNYSTFLNKKKTLTVEDINDILNSIDKNKKSNFDKNYIENLYTEYQSHKIDDSMSRKRLKKEFKGSSVIVIAPGYSVSEEKENIRNTINQSNSKVIAINFMPDGFKCDYAFFSNKKRFKSYESQVKARRIVTSNIINYDEKDYIINYSSLLSPISAVRDNSGVMLIKLLIDLGVKEIGVAGMDGYSKEPLGNYIDRYLSIEKPIDMVDETNSGLENSFRDFSKSVALKFITKPRYFNESDIISDWTKKTVSELAGLHE